MLRIDPYGLKEVLILAFKEIAVSINANAHASGSGVNYPQMDFFTIKMTRVYAEVDDSCALSDTICLQRQGPLQIRPGIVGNYQVNVWSYRYESDEGCDVGDCSPRNIRIETEDGEPTSLDLNLFHEDGSVKEALCGDTFPLFPLY